MKWKIVNVTRVIEKFPNDVEFMKSDEALRPKFQDGSQEETEPGSCMAELEGCRFVENWHPRTSRIPGRN